MANLLSSVRIVLLQTYHPGNIGAVARAMKTMGVHELYLVNPRLFPNEQAQSRAAGAADVLDSAVVVASLAEAVADCTQVFATSARKQHQFPRPEISCEDVGPWLEAHPAEKIAIVFGRERMGLSSDDLAHCQQLLYIPGNPDYSVLNLGAAVQIVCYELFKQLHDLPSVTAEPEYAKQDAIDDFNQHLQTTLGKTGFLRAKHPGETLQRLQQVFARAQLDAKEVSMLRGLLSSIDWHLDK